MAPPLRVLLAGSDATDLAAAQKFLTGKGMAATTCSTGSEARALIGKGLFDVVVAEVASRITLNQDPVDGLSLLQLAGAPPIAVSLDFNREPEIATTAVELGAVDVLHLPLAENAKPQLSMLWQHSLRRKRSASSAQLELKDSNDSQGSHSLHNQLGLTARQQRAAKEEALIKELLPGLFDADCDSEIGTVGARSGDQSSVATPDTPEIYSPLGLSATGMRASCSPFLSAELLQQHSCQESDACCLDSRHDSSHFSVDLDRLLQSEGLNMDLEPGCSSDLCRVLSGASLATSLDENLSEEERKSKKQKVEWTEELHQRFVRAVEFLGADKAVPSKILEHMGVAASGLTRQNIASHLQKYRNRKRTRQDLPFNDASSLLGSFPSPMASVPGTGCWSPHMAPTPSPFGLPTTFVPTCSGDAGWGLGAPLQAMPGEDIQSAIQELLKKPKATPPLGLKLDMRDVLKQLHQAQITLPK
ncbi:hypothetical protein WJX72_006096 [[Myrmecia] bisecta]|uniref:Uncharacterized protein n=1 Tax=[Myrmecia] bisecta TaxID=41462 RepID=A0AAW1P4P8_9CHLO